MLGGVIGVVVGMAVGQWRARQREARLYDEMHYALNAPGVAIPRAMIKTLNDRYVRALNGYPPRRRGG